MNELDEDYLTSFAREQQAQAYERAKHWPEVPKHDDVRTAVDWWTNTPCPACRGTGYMGGFIGDCWCKRLRRTDGGVSDTGIVHRPRVDVVCGGFPCQPASSAGLRLAQQDPRWLWPAMAQVIDGIRPRWVIGENVPGLLRRGLDDVVRDLRGIGYRVRVGSIPACAVGAPHPRQRLFILAHAEGSGCGQRGAEHRQRSESGSPGSPRSEVGSPSAERPNWWATEPAVARMANGIPGGMDRRRALGNAVVPQVAEHIGRLIVAADEDVAA